MLVCYLGPSLELHLGRYSVESAVLGVNHGQFCFLTLSRT